MIECASHRFVGTWHLDPSQSDYEFGQPPKQGALTFTYDGQYLRYTMEWTTADDKGMTLTLEVVPDGQDHAYHGNPAVADATRYTMIDEFTLDSEAKKQGIVVAYARRTISPDGQSMAITQSGQTPEGVTFDNRSVYRRS
jgi:hypothetical protein